MLPAMRHLRRWGADRLVPLGVLAGLMALRASGWPWVEGLQHRAFDALQNLAPRPYADAGVRIVDIDDASLARLGQWPWPRTLVAKLTRRLRERGAAAIAFDAIFPEPDRTAPSRAVELWPDDPSLEALKARVRRLPDHDDLLAREFQRSRVVAGFAPVAEASAGRPPRKAGFAFSGDEPLRWMDAFPGAIANLPLLDAQAAGVGSIGFTPEHDGILRRAPLVVRIGDAPYPALAVEALRVAQGAGAIQVKASGASGESGFGQRTGLVAIKVGRWRVPTDAHGRLWVHYAKDAPGRSIPAWKVLDPTERLEELQGAICFIGTSAAGLRDLRATPLDPAASGVAVHAGIVEQILTGDYLERPDWADGAEMLLTALLGLLLLAALTRLGPAWSAPLGLGAAAGALWLSWRAFTAWHLLLDPVFPAFAPAAVYLAFAATGFVRSERDRRRLTGQFGRYLSPKVVARLAEDDKDVELGGETREMTFHFCDIRGFTAISEGLDPHRLTELINRFLTPMTQIVLDHDGTVDKYMGDSLMAFWNAPHDVPDHAAKACAAALAMHARLAELNVQWQAEAAAAGRSLPRIEMGTGLNTGTGVVGNMGSALRLEYTVLGDDVNLASRLESQSKTYGAGIVIGPVTRAEAPRFATLELDLLKVKGKTRPARIFTLLGGAETAASEPFRRLATAHGAMLAAYRVRDWDAAERFMKEARALGGPFRLERLYDLYAARVAGFRASPPPADWDGIHVADDK
ncbi:MAG: adenylate/guanylate cyclase domain-containing protein [Elusimicrobia bacterium]|nr:adenylate/guanylate cyclase domain-containing protein [Elusimicrobiota bacterium]